MSERETSVEAQFEPALAAAAAPRLSVLHLMLWTLCSAVHFSLLRAIYAMQGDVGVGSVETIQQTSGLMHSVIAGAVIAGAIALVSARVRGVSPLLRQPGHWLLFVAAIMALISLPLVYLMLRTSGAVYSAKFFLAFGVVFLFPPIAFAFAANSSRTRHWRALFFAMLLVAMSQSSLYFGFWLSSGKSGFWMAVVSAIPTWGNLMLATAMMFVSIVELKTGPPRDWLHWTGVTAQLASSSPHLIWMFA
jgi:hypothetical protein